jgi:hypothetical protein
VFRQTIKSDRYIDHIFNQRFPQLTEGERLYGFFEQDGAMAYTTQDSLNTIFDIFADRVISEGLWPAWSADHTQWDFYLWNDLKDKVYKSNAHITAAQVNILSVSSKMVLF